MSNDDSGLSDPEIDEQPDICEQVRGANYLHACIGNGHPNTNIAFFSGNGEKHYVKIPHLHKNIKLSNTRNGLVATCV
jgi:hypothetical protein